MTDFNQPRAIIWCAVSSKPQAAEDKASLPEQETELRAAAERLGLRIVDVLIVDGHSRRYFNFPEFVEAAAVEGIDAPARLMEHWRRRDFDVFLCKDGSRFGRRQSIFGEVVERTIDAGAKLFTLQDGWIDSSNHHMFISMAGYAAASHVTRLIHDQQAAFQKRAERGLPHGPVQTISHKLIRDERSGKGIKLVPDESRRRLLEDAARLIIEGVSWHMVAVRLNEMGHLVDGLPLNRNTIYRAFYNPIFWGHTALGHNRRDKGLERRLWVFDRTEPIPEHITVYRDTHEPFLSAAMGERLQAEMRRRAQIRGKASPSKSHMFTGLLVCSNCLRKMVYFHHTAGTKYWRCQSKIAARIEPKCDVVRVIREEKVVNWLTPRLEAMIESGDAFTLARIPDAPDMAVRVVQLEAEIETAESAVRTLIMKQATAPASVGTIYDEQIASLGQQLERLRLELAEAERQAADANPAAARDALRELQSYADIAEFWAQPHNHINQLLHTILGRNRLVVEDGEVVGLTPNPRRY